MALSSDHSQCSKQPVSQPLPMMQSFMLPTELLPEVPPPPSAAAATPAPPQGTPLGFNPGFFIFKEHGFHV